MDSVISTITIVQASLYLQGLCYDMVMGIQANASSNPLEPGTEHGTDPQINALVDTESMGIGTPLY